MNPLDPIDLAVALMSIDSTSGREGAAIDFTAALLERAGWHVTRIPVTDGRQNLYAHDGGQPIVTLSTHIDTVPPYIPPRVDGDRVWGRGACDAKGIASAMICAADRLRSRGVPVGLLFVVGEEVSHDGARAANAFAAGSRVLVNGEPTEGRLATGTKGALRFTLRTEGRPAHSAYPELGVSATAALVRLLAELESLPLPEDPVLGTTTINIGSISGGVADNVMAPWAEARLMARLVTPASELLELLRAWVRDRAALEPGVTVPPVRLSTLPGFESGVVAFATDIPALTNWGVPYLYGPGSIHLAHRDDEHIRIAELRDAVGAYERIAVGAAEAYERGVSSTVLR